MLAFYLYGLRAPIAGGYDRRIQSQCDVLINKIIEVQGSDVVTWASLIIIITRKFPLRYSTPGVKLSVGF